MIIQPKIHEKGWGHEEWMHNDEKYCGKKLVLKAGKKCSIHFHIKKHETLYIAKGKVLMKVINDGREKDLLMGPGDMIEIAPGLMHSFYGMVDSEVFEFSTQHFEDDIYRYKKGY